MPLTDFMYAVSIGDEARVRKELENKVTCDENPGAVIIAAERNDLNLLKLLLEEIPFHFNVNYRDEQGNTPLITAIRMGHVAIVQYLAGREDINLSQEGPRGLKPFGVAVLTCLAAQKEILFHLLNTRRITSAYIEVTFAIISAPELCKNFIEFLSEEFYGEHVENKLYLSLSLLQHESIECLVKYSSEPHQSRKILSQIIDALTPLTPAEEADLLTAPSVDLKTKHPQLIAHYLMSYDTDSRGYAAFLELYSRTLKTNKIKVMLAIAQAAAIADLTQQERYITRCRLLMKKWQFNRETDLYRVIAALPVSYREKFFKEFIEKLTVDAVAKLLRYEDIRISYLTFFMAQFNLEELIQRLINEDDLISYQRLRQRDNEDKDLSIAMRCDSVKIAIYLLNLKWPQETRTGESYTRFISEHIESAIHYNSTALAQELCCIEKYGQHSLPDSAMTHLNVSNIGMVQTGVRYGCDLSKIGFEKTYSCTPFAALYIDTVVLPPLRWIQLPGNIISLLMSKNLYTDSIQQGLCNGLLLFQKYTPSDPLIFLLAQYLTMSSSRVNKSNIFGVTLLHEAVAVAPHDAAFSGSKLNPIRFLLQCGAKRDVKCIDGCTPHQLALMHNDSNVIELTRPASTEEISMAYQQLDKLFGVERWRKACDWGAAYFIWKDVLHIEDKNELRLALLYIVSSIHIDEILQARLVNALLENGFIDVKQPTVIASKDYGVLFYKKYIDYYRLPMEDRVSSPLQVELKSFIHYRHKSDSPYLLDACTFGYAAVDIAIQRNLFSVVGVLLGFSSCKTLINRKSYYLYTGLLHGRKILYCEQYAALFVPIYNGNHLLVQELLRKGAMLRADYFPLALLDPQKEPGALLDVSRELIARSLLEKLNKESEDQKKRSINATTTVQNADRASVLDLAALHASTELVEKILAAGAEYSPTALTNAFRRQVHHEQAKIIIILLCYMNQAELEADPANAQVRLFAWRETLIAWYKLKNEDLYPQIRQVLIASETADTAFFAVARYTVCPRLIERKFNEMHNTLLRGFHRAITFFGGTPAETRRIPAEIEVFRTQISEVTLENKVALFTFTLMNAIESNDVPLLEEVFAQISRVRGNVEIQRTREPLALNHQLITLEAELDRIDNESALGRLLLQAAELGHHQVMPSLLKRKANINYVSETESTTALHLAAQKGHDETVRFLLKSGADPLLRSRTGQIYSDVVGRGAGANLRI